MSNRLSQGREEGQEEWISAAAKSVVAMLSGLASVNNLPQALFKNRATLDTCSSILSVLHVCEEHVPSHVALLADACWLLLLARAVVRA